MNSLFGSTSAISHLIINSMKGIPHNTPSNGHFLGHRVHQYHSNLKTKNIRKNKLYKEAT